MKHRDEFNLAKLQMLQALARSQIAVASMIEQSAGIAGQYKLPVAMLHEQLRSLAGYQSTMISQLSGLRLQQPKRGRLTCRPWLNHEIVNNEIGKRYRFE